MKRIEIIVDEKGNTRIESKGFAGAECRQATAPLERALGVVTSDVPTLEMYLSPPLVREERLENQ
jgi:hypothetical protein